MSAQNERQPFHWRSNIGWKAKDQIRVRGYDLNELIGNITFAEYVHLLWLGELPDENVKKLLDALMVCFAEHQFSPSAVATRMVMAGSGSIGQAIPGGTLALGQYHAALQDAAEIWQALVSLADENGWSTEETADFFCRNVRAKESEKEAAFVDRFGLRNRLPGWHHPQHIRDPRPQRLLEVAESLQINGPHAQLIRALEDATKPYWGRRIFVNVVGCTAALLSDIGLPPAMCQAFGITTRAFGIAMHAYEEQTREKAWRASTRSDSVQPLDLSLQGPAYYQGAADRELPSDRLAVPLKRAPYGYVEGIENE